MSDETSIERALEKCERAINAAARSLGAAANPCQVWESVRATVLEVIACGRMCLATWFHSWASVRGSATARQPALDTLCPSDAPPKVAPW